MPYGAIEWVYDPKSVEADFVTNRLEEIQPFVRNGILIIQEVLNAGTVVTIELRAGHVLEDIVLDEVHSLVELVNESGMLYWIQVGRTGAFSLKAKVIEDGKRGQNKITKLRANLKDIPLREYLAKQAIVKIQPHLVKHSDYPDVMDIHQAAQYLGIKESTLHKIPPQDIPRTKHKNFRKNDLEIYLDKTMKRI